MRAPTPPRSICLLSRPLSSTSRACLSPCLPALTSVSVSGPPASPPLVLCLPAPAAHQGQGGGVTQHLLPPAPVNPCSAALRTATVAERCLRLTVSLDGGVPSGGGVSTGSPAGSESPACSPTQAGWRESSAPSCPSADQALRASSPPRPFRKVAQPHPRRAAPSRNSAFQPAIRPAARNKCTTSTSCTTVLGGPKSLFLLQSRPFLNLQFSLSLDPSLSSVPSAPPPP